MLLLGIDPGRKTGLALIRNNKIARLITTDFWGCYDLVLKFRVTQLAMIVIEISPDSYVWHEEKFNSAGVAGKIGQNVGAVRAEGELLADRLESLGYPVSRAKPVGKVGAPEFERLYNWKDKSNQHERDAARLAFSAFRWAGVAVNQRKARRRQFRASKSV